MLFFCLYPLLLIWVFSKFVCFPFQSIGIGYKRAHPDCVVSVQGFDPRPNIRIKASDSVQSFRRYGFVEAVQELDPAGSLGLLDQDYKV